jgi:hypothetical protein
VNFPKPLFIKEATTDARLISNSDRTQSQFLHPTQTCGCADKQFYLLRV